MKKKIFLITILSMIVIFTACVKEPPPTLESPITPKDWTEYIDEYAILGANSLKADGGKDIFHYKIQLEFEYNISGKEDLNDKFLLDINVNISLNEVSNNNGYVRILKLENNDYTPIFELYCDNDVIYLHSGDIKHKLEDAPLFEIIKNIVKGVETNKIENLLSVLGKNIFVDAYANKAKDTYTMVFDIKNFFNNIELKNFIESLPFDWQKALYDLASAESYKEFVDRLPNIRCNLITKIKDNRLASFYIENGTYTGNALDGIINLKTKEFIVDSILDNSILEKFPNDDDEYVNVDFGNIDSKGTVSLEGVNGSYMNYDYEFISSINIFQILALDGDISKLPEDNFFHLRIIHKCNDKCTSYCDSKLERGEGAIFDIAYSKEHFGTPFIYVSLNIKTLFSREFLNEAIPGIAGNLFALLSDYKLFTLDTGAYDKLDSLMLLKLILGFINISSFPSESTIEIDFNQFLKSLDIPDNILNLVTKLLSNGEDTLKNVRVTTIDKELNKVPNSNNIYNKTVFIIENYLEKTKSYDEMILDKASPAINWNFYEKFEVHNIESYNLYLDNRLCYGFENEKFIPMTEAEAKDINKMKIKYSYTNIYGEEVYTDISSNKNDATARIIKAEGINYQLFNQKQRVKLYISYPSYFMGSALFNILNNSLPLDDILFTTIETDIYLVKTKDITISREDIDANGLEKTSYYFGEKFDPLMLNATASLYYDNDNFKKISLVGEVEGLETNGYLMTEGNFTITYNVLGEVRVRVITVKSKEENYDYYFNKNEENVVLNFNTGSNINTFNYNQYFNFYIRHNEFDKNTYINILFFENLSINGVNIINSSEKSWSFVDEKLVFYKEGVYNIKYNFEGMIERTIKFSISTVQTAPLVSNYKINDTTSYRTDYFTSEAEDTYSYLFKGQLVNSLHGEVGIDIAQRLTVTIEKGYTNNYGSLEYRQAIYDEDYSIAKLKFDGIDFEKPYDNCLIPPLPPTIYRPKELSVNLKFITSGKYRVKFSIGRKISYTSKAFTVQEKL